MADAWRALIALEDLELYISGEPPEAAASWCHPVSGTPHFVCFLDLTDLLSWRGRIVRYAQQIDVLRGEPLPELEPCPWWRFWGCT